MSKKNKKKDREDEQSAPRPPWMFKALLAGLIVFVFLAAEVIGILLYKKEFSPEKDKLFKAYLGFASGYNPNMVSNYSPHPYLVYTLNPNIKNHYETFYGKQPVHYINSLGYRGKEFTVRKPDGVYRIVCVGGSTTFCLTEPNEENTYPALLEKALNKKFPGKRFEVINAGTPGWSSSESFINFHFRVLELDPDMVILYHGVNDTFAMRFEEEGKSDYSLFRKIVDYKPPPKALKPVLKYSHLARLLYYRTTDFSSDINGLAVRPYPSKKEIEKNLLSSTGKYFRRNMRGMAIMAKSNGIVPVIMTMGHNEKWVPVLVAVNKITREVAAETGSLLVDFERVGRPEYFADDGVHLAAAGNVGRVQAILSVLDERMMGELFRIKKPPKKKDPPMIQFPVR